MRFLFRRGLLKGVFGGSTPWTVLWVLIAGVRILRRLLRDKPEVVYSERLEPGQALVISAKDREPKVIGA
jgi:hypothetical protein